MLNFAWPQYTTGSLSQCEFTEVVLVCKRLKGPAMNERHMQNYISSYFNLESWHSPTHSIYLKLEAHLSASKAAYLTEASRLLLYCPCTARSICTKVLPELQWSKQEYKWLLQTACTCTLHLLALIFQHTKHCHPIVAPLWWSPRCHHPSLQGQWLSWLRQSRLCNEYTCVVCNRQDTGWNRAREEDEYWVNVLCRVGLYSQFPSHDVLCCKSQSGLWT